MRIRELGMTIGTMKPGPLNRISDVAGVTVGHTTIIDSRHNTGITVIMPSNDNPFQRKLPCASYVWNGFGKTQGLVQIEELGTLETPIALTNTLNVGLVHDAMVSYMISRCAEDGIRVTSVNPVVAECNDASLNDIRDRAVREPEVLAAIADARPEFAEGAVGAGRGMTCHGLKGGIGSSSRLVSVDGTTYTLGVLVLTNHGRLRDLTVAGDPIGEQIEKELHEDHPDKGSCIMVLATDLPADSRQLGRIIRRCSVGLARLGSYVGHGSGEIMIGFSTANRVDSRDKKGIQTCQRLNEDRMDLCFRAAAEATEEAVLNSMTEAVTVTGPTGTVRRSLAEFLIR